MADYKRMVSYMYQYENGIKRKNVGYVRVEARNGQCKFTIHMQLPGQSDSIFPTYLIHRDGSGIDLIYLGDSILKMQLMDSKFITDENNIMESGHSLKEMSGVLIFMNNNIFFATVWDDKALNADELHEAMRPKKNKKNEKVYNETDISVMNSAAKKSPYDTYDTKEIIKRKIDASLNNFDERSNESQSLKKILSTEVEENSGMKDMQRNEADEITKAMPDAKTHNVMPEDELSNEVLHAKRVMAETDSESKKDDSIVKDPKNEPDNVSFITNQDIEAIKDKPDKTLSFDKQDGEGIGNKAASESQHAKDNSWIEKVQVDQQKEIDYKIQDKYVIDLQEFEEHLSLEEELKIPTYKLPRGLKAVEMFRRSMAVANKINSSHVGQESVKDAQTSVDAKAGSKIGADKYAKAAVPDEAAGTIEEAERAAKLITETDKIAELIAGVKKVAESIAEAEKMAGMISEAGKDTRSKDDAKVQESVTEANKTAELINEMEKTTEAEASAERAAKPAVDAIKAGSRPAAEKSAKASDGADEREFIEHEKSVAAADTKKAVRSINEAQKDNKTERDGRINDIERIISRFTRLYPFEDNEILMCVKIEPKDIGLLPKEVWPFSSNSFLLHGYYCYHHLILAKMKYKDKAVYILGVPGLYQPREQFMARMFGFDNFKSIKKREPKKGDFGYWYLQLPST